MEVDQEIRRWVKAKPDAFLYQAPKLEGGWKSWAQVDMALTWTATDSYLIDTDIPVYKDEDLDGVDILVAIRSQLQESYDIIELSAMRFAEVFVGHFYKQQIGADIDKLQNDLSSRYFKHPDRVRRWAVGLVPVDALRHEYNSEWTDEEALLYVQANFEKIKTPNNKLGEVTLNHRLAKNGTGSIIISWWLG